MKFNKKDLNKVKIQIKDTIDNVNERVDDRVNDKVQHKVWNYIQEETFISMFLIHDIEDI
jgi:hypothetical protein